MKKLYKVFATKTIPVIILADQGFDKNPDWEVIEDYVREEEKNVHGPYEMEILPMEPNEKLKYPFSEWHEGCNVYHDGDREYTLSDARIVTSLNEIIQNLAKNNNISLDEAKKNLIDTIHASMVD